MKKIVVVGAGAFGTALAMTSSRCGHQTVILARNLELIQAIEQTLENKRYLPGIKLPSDLKMTANPESVRAADAVILATPAQCLAETCQQLSPFLNPGTPIIIAAKGIDRQRLQPLSDVARGILSNPIAILSGPSFAIEMAHSLPTAVMIAADNLDLASDLSSLLRHSHFRCYASSDLIGVQIAGAVKNVIAIASGITRGRNLGENASAALLSRGLAEMTRLGTVMGGRIETFLGLAGVGDLILTGSSQKSRNFSLGYALGQGQTLEDILKGRHTTTEGVATAAAVMQLAKTHSVRMPICHSIHDLLHCQANLDLIIENLLARQATAVEL